MIFDGLSIMNSSHIQVTGQTTIKSYYAEKMLVKP